MTIDYEIGQEVSYLGYLGREETFTIDKIVIEKDRILLCGQYGGCDATRAVTSPEKLFDLLEIEAKQIYEDRLENISEQRRQYQEREGVK